MFSSLLSSAPFIQSLALHTSLSLLQTGCFQLRPENPDGMGGGGHNHSHAHGGG